MAVASVSAAEGGGIEERLRELEAKVATLAQENTVLKKQLGVDAQGKPTTGILAPMGKEAKLAIGGFIHLQGEFGDAADQRFPAADRFLVRRVRLGVKSSFAENIDGVMQADFGNNSLNATSGFRAQLTDAYMIWRKYSAANVTAGQFKVPYGYEQLQSDTKIATIERSLSNDQLTLPRQVGLMVSGAVFNNRLTYAGAVGNGNGTNISINDNDEFMYIGRVAGTAFDNKTVKITLGANAYTSDDTGTFTGRRTGRGIDAQLAVRGFEFTGELLRTHFDREVGADYDAEGWAVMGSYLIVPNRLLGVLRYESYDPNTSTGRDRTLLRTVGLSWLIKGDDLKFSLNYLIGNPPGATSHKDRLLCRLQLIF